MNIKKIVWQDRRDFTAIYQCVHCGKEKTGPGYDDANFHKNVITAMTCDHCGKTAREDYVPQQTKYLKARLFNRS